MTSWAMGPKLSRFLIVLGLGMLLALGACASNNAEDDAFLAYEEPSDPIEPINRAIFDFNNFLDGLLLKPLAELYGVLLPQGARDSIRNFLRNLATPVTLANDLLQGEMDRAGNTTARFLVNTTIGVGGLFDIAEKQGYPYHSEDFGQTMAVHGVDDGFYLVLPILGPSTARDATGRVVDIFLDPLTYVANNNDWDGLGLARTAVSGIDARERNIETLEELKRDSVDFYARIRSLYYQTRQKEISNGEGDLPYLPAPGAE
ncbi:MAG: VacJ family lipoprotein [Rhodovibrionaceae bacterium]|nr:VacJ family lipoprotein [Rhodovibrionaceae bacterium]